MQRYIDAVSKADVLETYAELYDVFDDNKNIQKELHKVYDKLNALPSVQKKGKWIDPAADDVYRCSACGNYLDFRGVNAGRGNAIFCPNCGTQMEAQ